MSRRRQAPTARQTPNGDTHCFAPTRQTGTGESTSYGRHSRHMQKRTRPASPGGGHPYLVSQPLPKSAERENGCPALVSGFGIRLWYGARLWCVRVWCNFVFQRSSWRHRRTSTSTAHEFTKFASSVVRSPGGWKPFQAVRKMGATVPGSILLADGRQRPQRLHADQGHMQVRTEFHCQG